MKKISTYILISLFALSLATAPTTAFAQREEEMQTRLAPQGIQDAAGFEASLAATPASPASAAAERLEPEGCNLLSTEIFTCGLAYVAYSALKLTAYLLKMGGAFLNLAMTFTLDLSSYAASIEAGWRVLRDLINITLIFGILWIAFQTILDRGEWRRPLTSIILAALFINFSLFFTKVIIDASNIVALQFYTSITGGTFTPITGISSIFSSAVDSGISDYFMDRLKIITIFDAARTNLNFGNIALIGLFGSIFIIITAAVFFIAGLMLIARSAILLLLMLTSPIGFAGTWLPKLQEYRGMWWKNLVDQSLFAPVFLLLVWGVLKITETNPFGDMLTPSGVKANFAGALTGNASSMGIILNFLLMIALIVAALRVAQQLSGAAGKGFAGWSQKALGTMAFGGGAFLARNTAGRAFARLAESQWFREMAGKEGVGGRLAMLGLRGAERVAKSSMDVRNIPTTLGAGAALKMAGAQIDFGKGKGAGGFRKTEDEAIKERVKEQQAAAKLLEFKETDKEKEVRKAAFLAAGGKEEDFKSAKEITAQRQQAFAKQITPAHVPTFAGPLTATRLSTAGFRADIEAAGKIAKATKDEGKVEKELNEERKLLRDILGVTKDDDITTELIEKKLSALEKNIGDAKAKAQKLPAGASVSQISAAYADEQRAVRKLNEFKEMRKEIDRLEDKLEKIKDKNKGDGGGEKKKEAANDGGEDKKAA